VVVGLASAGGRTSQTPVGARGSQLEVDIGIVGSFAVLNISELIVADGRRRVGDASPGGRNTQTAVGQNAQFFSV